MGEPLLGEPDCLWVEERFRPSPEQIFSPSFAHLFCQTFNILNNSFVDNITKQCLEDGGWANYTNYEACLNHQIAPPVDPDLGPVTEWEVLIFLLGYSVSIISLLFAIFIFMYFR